MLYLDNDVLAKFARPHPDPNVVEYLKRHHDEPWAISAIVAYEFVSYYDRSEQRGKLQQLETEVLEEITPIDARTSLEVARLGSLLESAGTSLETADLFVAATARQRDATLATANVHDFDKEPVRQLLDVDVVDTSE